MSLATARRDIETRLAANWALTRVSYDNAPFKTARTDESWVRCQIFEETADRVNLGNPGMHRVAGLIILSVYVPLEKGTSDARDYADQLSAIFRDKQFGGITCWEAIPRNAGEFQSWYQYDVSIRFFWDGFYAI